MKLLLLFNFIALLNVSANVYCQNEKLNIEVEDMQLRDLFREIEKNSEYAFFFNDEYTDLEKAVTLNLQNVNVDNVLEKVLKGSDLDYRILQNNFIIILPKSKKIQQIVTGTVTDKDGGPLPGVSIIIKGTTTGTITDFSGNYSLDVPDSNAVLIFSYVGYLTQEVAVGSQKLINVTLEVDERGIEEVVVVGYGVQKKETLTGSVSNISGKEITEVPSPNLTNTLTGKLTGVFISQRSGEPGRDDPNILIRGNGTFDYDPDDNINPNSPLIIIDGVERSLIGRLNPDDVESISVLKDASASIYGARAANGVIIVTTKKGNVGKPVFNFSYNHAFQHPTKVPDMLDAATFAEVFNEAEFYRQGWDPVTFNPYFSDEAIQNYRNGSDPVLYPNTNWMKEVLKPYSSQRRMSLQVTGGSEAVRYFLSFATLNQDGDYKNNPTDYNQYNLRAKVDVNLTKNLSIGANINAILNDKTYTTVDTWINFNNILIANPTLVARYPNGLIAPGRLGENPLLMDQRGYDKTEDNPLYSTFTAAYNIPFIKGFKVEASFNYDLSNQFQKEYNLPYFYHEYDVNTGEYVKRQGTGASTVELTDTYRKWTTIMYNYRINYDRTFDKHHVAAMLGQEQQKNKYTWANAYRKNFVSPAVDQIDVGSSDPENKNNGGSASESAYNNYFGRVNYDYMSKYLFEFLFRYDGSQNFPEGKRYGFFPGISVGWRLSEEGFIQNSLPFVNQLKLRFSHGQIGNDRIKQYQYLQSYSFGHNYVFGTADVPGIYANTMPNPNVTWEVSKKTDIGLETSLWNDLLGMELTYWMENRSNILTQRSLSVPGTYGFPALPPENIGEVDNHGFEVIVSHRNKIGKLDYRIEANTSFARSKIVFMDETPHTEVYQDITGHPVGSFLIYQADGIFHTQEELDAYPHANGTHIGDIKILDLNGDGEINSEDQFRFDKSAIPEIIFGLNMNFQYQGFDLGIFIQGQTNAYNYDDVFARLGNTAFDNAIVDRAQNRWTVDNPNGTMPRADAYQPGNTTFFLYDATFIRLKTLELGYSLPQNLTSKVKLSDARIYVSAFNLLTWAKEIKWSDPEISGNSLYYPQQRVINLGINVKF